MSEETTETGPITREQAVAMLIEAPTEQQAPEAPVTAAEGAEEPEGEANTPEVAEDGAENPAEDTPETEVEAEAVAPVDPPKYWSTEAKAQFAELSPELQAVVLAQEGPREEAAAKAKAQAAEQISAAQKDGQRVQALADHLASFLPDALQTFQSRWGQQEPDWAAVAQEHGADQAFILKSQFDKEQRQFDQLQQATKTAQAEAQQSFVQTEWKALAEMAPELAPDVSDPKKGFEVRQKIVKYLTDGGIPKASVDQISAFEMSLAHDGIRWREAQATLKAAPKPKPAAPAPKAPVRPAVGQAQVPTQQREAQRLNNRFAQTGNREDAVALILAKGL